MKTTGFLRVVIMVIVIMIIILLSSSAYQAYDTKHTLEIPVEQARHHKFQLIIDVRTPKEREELGFYPNSIPIPLQDLLTEVPSLIGSGLSSKQKTILVYANGDRRAHVAAEMLAAHGYSHVRYLSSTYDKMMPGRG